jgi:hypothetical protein
MIFGILKLVVLVLFLYLVWRNLRDDYKENELIDYSWLAVTVALVTGRLSYGLINWGVWNESLINWFVFWSNPGFNYVGAVAGLMLVTWWNCRDKEWKLWPFLEKITWITYLILSLLMLGEGLWFHAVVFVIAMVIAIQISGRYRAFVWYKSGKRGFVFFLVNLLVGLMLALVSWWLKDGPIVIIIYLILSLISGVGLVMLANDEN